MSFYPTFECSEETLWALTLIIQRQTEDPTYLTDSECPYPSDFVELIKELTRSEEDKENSKTLADLSEKGEGAVWEGLEEETKQLYLDLKTSKSGLKANDATGQMAFFRTSTSLLEKLVGLQERATGVKELHEFKEQAFRVIDSVLNEEQRQQVLAIFRMKGKDTDESI